MYVARVLRSKVDSVFSKNIKANIVIVGDFNDDPTDKSIMKVLKAKNIASTTYPGMLYNLSYKKFKAGDGSYYYSREKKWNMLDQIIVSGNLFNDREELRLNGYDACIFRADWLMFENSDGVKQPSRTKGRSYYGGYSDHLPVYLNLMIK